jgi:beta-1,4-glucosyltransferase
MTFDHSENTNALPHLEIAGIRILDTTSDVLNKVLCQRQQQSLQSILFFANSNFIVNGRTLFQPSVQSTQNVLIANDGVALNIASRLIHHKIFSDNLNGTDFSPYFLSHYPGTLRIFLLGAKPDVVAKARGYVAANFSRHQVVGIQDGYFDRANSQSVIDRINFSQADILFVAMGNPLQEQWILEHQHALNPSYIFGVGALFDFWSGSKIRAPRVIQALHLEWLFRLCQEPKRLLKRYSVDMVKFLYISLRYSNKT